jgi:MinD-like ATPase involved in chromosome partitioning or flagellar assembly
MSFKLDKILTPEDKKALESTIRKRANLEWFRKGTTEFHLKVRVYSLSGSSTIQALEKIHASIQDQIAHRVTKVKEKASALA